MELEGYAVVVRLSLVIEAKSLHYLFQNVGRALQMARRAPADFDIVLARRSEPEVGVEGSYAPYLVDGSVVKRGYFFDGFIGYISQLILYGEKR